MINQDNVPETWEVIITDPSAGAYKLAFQDPDTLEFVTTDDVMKANDSADTFRKRIYNPYYRHHVGSTVTVTTTYKDENGLETTDFSLAKQLIYTVQVDKRISSYSFASISVLKDPANTSTIELKKPTDLGGLASSAPLEGKYILNCPDPIDPAVIHQTREINHMDWGPGIEQYIDKDIPFLASKTSVQDLGVTG